MSYEDTEGFLHIVSQEVHNEYFYYSAHSRAHTSAVTHTLNYTTHIVVHSIHKHATLIQTSCTHLICRCSTVAVRCQPCCSCAQCIRPASLVKTRLRATNTNIEVAAFRAKNMPIMSKRCHYTLHQYLYTDSIIPFFPSIDCQ